MATRTEGSSSTTNTVGLREAGEFSADTGIGATDMQNTGLAHLFLITIHASRAMFHGYYGIPGALIGIATGEMILALPRTVG